jgi:TPR repeat protein
LKSGMRLGLFLALMSTGSIAMAKHVPAPAVATDIASVQVRASKGDPGAELLLGRHYFSGDGVPQSYNDAVNWFKKAAAKGNATAQSNLCYMYSNNKELPADYPQALDWCRKAAKKGDTLAESMLGGLFFYGSGV